MQGRCPGCHMGPLSFQVSGMHRACIHSLIYVFTLVNGHLLYDGIRIRGWAKWTVFALRSFQSSEERY